MIFFFQIATAILSVLFKNTNPYNTLWLSFHTDYWFLDVSFSGYVPSDAFISTAFQHMLSSPLVVEISLNKMFISLGDQQMSETLKICSHFWKYQL